MYRVLGTLAFTFLALAAMIFFIGCFRKRYIAHKYPRLRALGEQIKEATMRNVPEMRGGQQRSAAAPAPPRAEEIPPAPPMPRGEHADRPWPPEPAPYTLPTTYDDTQAMENVDAVFEQEYDIFRRA